MSRRPIWAAYSDTGAIDVHCPNCSAEPGQWCTRADGVARRIPCVDRTVSGIGVGDGRPYARDFSEPAHPTDRTDRQAMNHEHTSRGPDSPDPIRAAFDDYQRAPRDVVAAGEPKPADDVAALAGTATTVTHLTEDGPVTQHVTVAKPFIPKHKRGQQK